MTTNTTIQRRSFSTWTVRDENICGNALVLDNDETRDGQKVYAVEVKTTGYVNNNRGDVKRWSCDIIRTNGWTIEPTASMYLFGQVMTFPTMAKAAAAVLDAVSAQVRPL